MCKSSLSVAVGDVQPFFGPSEPTTQARRHPDHWRMYKRVFLDDCDWSRFNVRNGHDGIWQPARGKKRADGEVVKEWDRPLGSCDHELERHLAGPGSINRPCTWVGTFGGKYLGHFALDVDNHAAKGKGHRDGHGHFVQVADLSVEYLSRAKTAYDVLLDLPTVVMTSSRSLGLNYWQLLPQRELGHEVFWGMRRYLDEKGLRGLEVHPMYDAEGNGNRCHRRPFGDGGLTLTTGGFLRPWWEQLEHFLEPTPAPNFAVVVELLIGLWADQYRYWEACGSPRPEARDFEHQAGQIDLIRRWAADGCLPCKSPCEPSRSRKRAQRAARRSSPVTAPGSGNTAILPEGLRALPRQERVLRIARDGLPCKGTLNPCLLTLANHLISLELYDEPEREQVAKEVLTKYCLNRHNGHSSRLDGTEPLPKVVLSLIDYTIKRAVANAELPSFRSLREKSYCRPLRLRSIICGEGPEDQYISPTSHPPNTYKSSLYSVPDSEGRLRDDLLNPPLPPHSIEAIQQHAGRKPRAAIEFNTRFCNFLRSRGGRAKVNRDEHMPVLLGYKSNDKWSRYTATGMNAGLYRRSGRPVRGKQSTEYELLLPPRNGADCTPHQP